MKVYVRKLFKHDITHEVSILVSIIKKYFEDDYGYHTFVKKGDKTCHKYKVNFNTAKDARFGGDFKSIYKDDNACVGDFLIIRKIESHLYEFSIVQRGSQIYDNVARFFPGPRDRHALVDENQVY